MAKVAILGLGLIGGSLALALVKAHEVVGWDPARPQKTPFKVAKNPAEAIDKADLVVLAAPLSELSELVREIAAYLPEGAVVTDVGGAKQPITKVAHACLPGGSFVGGHPMAGSVGQGYVAADPELFRDCNWALTPASPAENDAADRIEEWLAPCGARFHRMSPEEHDRAVAFTSHLPYLVSLALARSAKGAEREGLAAIAALIGPGFRDTTRLAMTPPELGRDMAAENREAVLSALAAFRYQVSQLEVVLQNKMDKELEKMAADTAAWRARF